MFITWDKIKKLSFCVKVKVTFKQSVTIYIGSVGALQLQCVEYDHELGSFSVPRFFFSSFSFFPNLLTMYR